MQQITSIKSPECHQTEICKLQHPRLKSEDSEKQTVRNYLFHKMSDFIDFQSFLSSNMFKTFRYNTIQTEAKHSETRKDLKSKVV